MHPEVEVGRILQSELYDYPPFVSEDPVDRDLRNAHDDLKEHTQGMSEAELLDYLQVAATQSMEKHGGLCDGLLYGALVAPPTTNELQRTASCLRHFVRDHYGHVIGRLKYFTGTERFVTMRQNSQVAILRLSGDFTREKAPGIDSLYVNLLRQVEGNCNLRRNTALAETLLMLLKHHDGYLKTFELLMNMAMYAFLRMIVELDKVSPKLQKMMIRYCVDSLRARWEQYQRIGRELMRVLHDLVEIKEFKGLWSDMVERPRTLSNKFSGPWEVVANPTPRIIYLARISHGMQQKLLFIMEQCVLGAHHAHWAWFLKRYIEITPERVAGSTNPGPLLCDVARYVIAAYHPANAQLASNVVPRYEILAAILSHAQTKLPGAAPTLKLCIFYDWLFFDPNRDSIMLIEPAGLLLYRYMERTPRATAELLEFLFFLMEEFYKEWRAQIQAHIEVAMASLRARGVISRVSPFFTYEGLPPTTRDTATALFPKLAMGEDPLVDFTTDLTQDAASSVDGERYGQFKADLAENPPEDAVLVMEDADGDAMLVEQDVDSFRNSIHEATFPLDRLRQFEFERLRARFSGVFDENSPRLPAAWHRILAVIAQLVFEVFPRPGDRDAKFALGANQMKALLDSFVTTSSSNENLSVQLFSGLIGPIMLAELYSPRDLDVIMPDIATQEPVTNIRGYTLPDILYSCLIKERSSEDDTGEGEEDPYVATVRRLLSELDKVNEEIGGGLLLHSLRYYKPDHHGESGTVDPYLSFATRGGMLGASEAIHKDLCTILQFDADLFVELIPFVFPRYPDLTFGNSKLLHTILVHADPEKSVKLSMFVILRNWHFFREDQLAKLIEESKVWAEQEQRILWSLIQAQFGAANNLLHQCITFLLRALDISKSEHLQGISALLRQHEPTEYILASLLQVIGDEWGFQPKIRNFVKGLFSHYTQLIGARPLASILSRALRKRFIADAGRDIRRQGEEKIRGQVENWLRVMDHWSELELVESPAMVDTLAVLRRSWDV